MASVSREFFDKELGRVRLRLLSTATRYTARWKSADLLMITVPTGETYEQIVHAIDTMRPRLLACRPAARNFAIGWSYDTPECHFEVRRGDRSGYFQRVISDDGKTCSFLMPPEYAAEGGPEFNKFVNERLREYARNMAPQSIKLHAIALGLKLGVRYRSLDIMRGERTLGKCTARKDITLSYNLMFYPMELRELVMAHEFAHLTHLDHSEAFYSLLDRYLDGRHAVLRRALKAHRLPYIP